MLASLDGPGQILLCSERGRPFGSAAPPARRRDMFGERLLPNPGPRVRDPRDQLQADLADRYVLERELGRGGMATVYLACDLKHDRLLALKVLHPELAATLGPEWSFAEGQPTSHGCPRPARERARADRRR